MVGHAPVRLARSLPQTLRQIKGIGPKSVAVLAALSITTVAELKEQVDLHGPEWIRDNLPFGVNWRVVSRTII
jgi:predicted flap endonuclease-1-like 5' DNA nuclease